jgi:hypothetical protein
MFLRFLVIELCERPRWVESRHSSSLSEMAL